MSPRTSSRPPPGRWPPARRLRVAARALIFARMGKKHCERREKRQRAKAERRRVDIRRRQVAARAQLEGVPRKEHEPGLRWQPPIRTAAPPLPPPSDEELRPVRHAIDELRHGGGGEFAVDVREWTPAVSDSAPARIVLEFRLFGLTATVEGSIGVLHLDDLFDPNALPGPDDADYDEWQAAAIARQLLAAVRTDVDAARALITFWALDELLADDLLLDRPLIAEVLRRLDLGPELADILDPLAPALPEPLREFWQQNREEWSAVDGVPDFVLSALSWDVSGPLVDFAETIASATYHTNWRPPWPTLDF